MNDQVSAGWHPSPGEAGTERYWDGAAWTDQRRPAAPQPQPPMGGPPPQQVIIVKKKSKALWIILGLMVVLLGGCIALIASAGEAIDDAVEQGAVEDELVEAAAEITSCGVQDGTGWGEAIVDFTNPLDEEKGFISIEINFLNSEGVVVGSGSVTFENLGAGQRAQGEALGLDLVDGAEVATCEVVDSTTL